MQQQLGETLDQTYLSSFFQHKHQIQGLMTTLQCTHVPKLVLGLQGAGKHTNIGTGESETGLICALYVKFRLNATTAW